MPPKKKLAFTGKYAHREKLTFEEFENLMKEEIDELLCASGSDMEPGTDDENDDMIDGLDADPLNIPPPHDSVIVVSGEALNDISSEEQEIDQCLSLLQKLTPYEFLANAVGLSLSISNIGDDPIAQPTYNIRQVLPVPSTSRSSQPFEPITSTFSPEPIPSTSQSLTT